jgi:DDE superfamily endonuclease
MEDVLELYAAPYDPRRPVVGFDEVTKELHGEVRSPLPARPGDAAREDYEYTREGTANLFLVVEPLTGRRHLAVTERRTRVDFAEQMKYLCDELYPEAEVIRVVLDNLNTHGPASLYEAFPPGEARRLTGRLEFHHTPKHASWLNVAELELSVLARQCLGRRIATREELARAVAAWEAERNAARAKIAWGFRVADARVKLAKLYPVGSRETSKTSVSDH